MTYAEFEEKVECIYNKITASERELLEQMLNGAEVNHSIIYVLIAFGIGGAFGCLMTMLLV